MAENDQGTPAAEGDAKEPPAIPPPGKRAHKATYARDKRNPGSYLIRVIGPHATAFAGRQVPVTRKDDTESVETLELAIWAGNDEETGKPVALYRFVQKPRDEAEDTLPF